MRFLCIYSKLLLKEKLTQYVINVLLIRFFVLIPAYFETKILTVYVTNVLQIRFIYTYYSLF